MSSNTPESTDSTAKGRFRFLLTRRWISYFVLLVIFAIACGFLSNWQLDRRQEKVSENQRVAANFDADPQPLASVLPTLASYDVDDEWTPVEMHGHYLLGEQVLARTRPFNGLPGFEILTPFQTTEGTIFIVDRGWIPTGHEQDAPDAVPAAPPGELTITARLKSSEPTIPGRTAPAGQIPTINLPQLAQMLGSQAVYTGAYGLLRSESVPAEAGQLPAKPEPTEGNHLSYAVQWVAFAVIALVGLLLGLREEYRERNPDDPKVKRALEKTRDRARSRRPSDADEEDALIDADRARR